MSHRYLGIVAAAAIVLGLCGCSDEAVPNWSGAELYDEGREELVDQGVEGAGEEDVSHIYLSYDDSASTVAVELVKYQLSNDQLPPPGLARPWEFLNYESFDAGETLDLGTFEVSMGLWRRDAASVGDVEYRLGVSVATPEIQNEDRDSVVLTLVVDVSGSMDTGTTEVEEVTLTRMELAVYALEQLADALLIGDIVSLVTFSDSAEVVFEGLELPADREEYLAAVADLVTVASTDLDAGIQLGYEVARRLYDPAKRNRVIMLTDAYANTGEVDATVISDTTRIENQEGIYFSGLGVGEGFAEEFLDELTEAGKGAYFALITRHDARRAFGERFVSLVLVAARDVGFRLDYPPTLERDVSAAEESSTEESEVQTTNFSFNTSQYFFEGFRSAEDIGEEGEFVLTVTYRDPQTGEEMAESQTFCVADILGLQEANIRAAETIYLLTQLIGGSMTAEEVAAVLAAHYEGYSSDLVDEYRGLIETYLTLSEGG